MRILMKSNMVSALRGVVFVLAILFLGTGCFVGSDQVKLVTVSPNGCTASGVCPWGAGVARNYWYQPTHEVVLDPKALAGGSYSTVLHDRARLLEGFSRS